MKGKFYGIGVGPGDPDLITLKGVKVLNKVDIVISPESVKGKGSIAFNIAEEHLGEDIEILKLTFPMTYDEEILNDIWNNNAEIILEKLNEGKNIAFLTLGDPMVYSTYMYMLNALKNKNVEVETIPGITSFCATASQTNIPISKGDETICILPLRKGCENLDYVLDNFDNIIVMKPSHDNKLLAQKLTQKKLDNKFVMVSKCGTNEQEITYDIDRLKNDKVPYLSTVIIKKEGIK